jgi:hypothetical protein
MNISILLCSLLLLIPNAVFGAPKSSDLVGTWNCSPYEIKGDKYIIMTIDYPTYLSDGEFTERSTATLTTFDGTIANMEIRMHGRWTLTNDIIEILFTKGEFISSDNSAFPVSAGQESLDAQIKRKNWVKLRVLSSGDELVTMQIEAENKQAEVETSCIKA